VAEQVVYGSVTTGAENDLKQVTDLARAMVTRWGMAPEVGPLMLAGGEDGDFLEGGFAPGQERPYSEETARAIDAAVRRIVEECYARAFDLLAHERARLDALTEALLREESLDLAQMLAVTGLPPKQRGTPPEPAATRPLSERDRNLHSDNGHATPRARM